MFNANNSVIVFESLKKRSSGVYRPVPVPPVFLDTLNMGHDIKTAHRRRDRGKSVYLWSWGRTIAWRRVCDVMAGREDHRAARDAQRIMPRFGIKTVTSQVPLNMVQKWLGHAQLATTSIYADAITGEEATRQLAEKMWY